MSSRRHVETMSEQEQINLAIALSMSGKQNTSTASKKRNNVQGRRNKKTNMKSTNVSTKSSTTLLPQPKNTPTPLDGRLVLRVGSESHALAKTPTHGRFFDTRSLNWDDVVEFISFEHGTTSCPVCQEPPLAARVCECGHRVCLPCFLRTEQYEANVKCSICAKPLSRSRLKRSTVAVRKTDLKIGSTVSFQLVQQPFSHTEVLPVPLSLHNGCCISSEERSASLIAKDASDLEQFLSLAQQDAVELKGYGRVDMANKELKDAVNLVQWSFTMLAEEAERELAGSKNVAARAVLMAIRRTMSIYNDVGKKVKGNLPVRRWEAANRKNQPTTAATTTSPQVNLAKNKLWVLDVCPQNQTKSLTQPTASKLSSSSAAEKIQFYYYQISTGEYYFLHPLMVRILKDMYGSYEHFPPTINVKIVQIDEEVLHANNYNRYKYLRTVPLGSHISFCEVQLGGGSSNGSRKNAIVSKEVLKKYKHDLTQRSKLRQQRNRRDDRFSKKAAKRTEESYKAFVFATNNNGVTEVSTGVSNPLTTPELSSEESFPIFGGKKEAPVRTRSGSGGGGVWSASTVSSDVKQFDKEGQRSLYQSSMVMRSRSNPNFDTNLGIQTYDKDGQAAIKSHTRLNLHSIISSFDSTKNMKKKKKNKGIVLFSTSNSQTKKW
jgi:hypothetical protein